MQIKSIFRNKAMYETNFYRKINNCISKKNNKVVKRKWKENIIQRGS